NDHAEAMGSDLAVQDVVDAIDFAIGQGGVDANRVYAVGLSGGGMMALLLAGRHPDRLAAVAAWSPVYDLVAFYQQSRSSTTDYRWQIRRVCGGSPTTPGPAQDECLHRSPITYLDVAREQGVPVYLGQGVGDTLLRPSNAAFAFNQLADPEDRLTAEEVEEIGRRRVPEHLSGETTIETFFVEGDPAPVFARHSGAVWFVLFPGNHDMVYGPALRWFASDPR
ncbi:MAG TPA: prolyl oligopeptidase family serine peptidase, partial [Acidimicrobiia bacterium]|nr:prolyl oligopeptidase family serine peptidase [Acidimicrobiia bacterium]